MNKLLFRESRLSLIIWVVALSSLSLMNISAIAAMFNTQQMWDEYISTVSTPVGLIFTGPGIGLTGDEINLGAAFIGKAYTMMIIAMCIMNTIFITNWNRGFEEDGQTELLLANPVKRHSLQISSLTMLTVMNFIIVAVSSAAFLAFGQALVDTLVVHVALFLLGEVFAVLALLVSAVLPSARTVKFTVIGKFVVLYCIGAFGWVQGVQEEGIGHFAWYAWISPATWVFSISPFTGELKFAGIILLIVTLTVLSIATFIIYKVRDMNETIIKQRDSRQSASVLLRNMFALRFRNCRIIAIGWAAGLFALGLAYGSMIKTVLDMLQDSPEISSLMNINADAANQAFESASVTLVNSFVGYIQIFFTIIASAFMISNVTATLARDENTGVYELFFAQPLSRIKYLLQTYMLLIILANFTLMMGVIGFFGGVKVAGTDIVEAGDMLVKGAHLLLIPLFFTALATFLFAINRKLTNFAWVYFGFATVSWMFGSLLKFPDWLLNIGIFQHFTTYPIETFASTPFIVFAILTALLFVSSLVLYRRRDLV